jgi:imidazolonepropionase-like amidohydrolase
MLTQVTPATTTAIAQTPIWHLRAVRLPDGDHPEDWWITDGRLHEQPISGARDLPGGYVLPGLVDSHAHISIDFNQTGLPRGSAEIMEANLNAHLRAGVLAVRDLGFVPGSTALDPQPVDQPHVIPAGRFFAPPGRYFHFLSQPVIAEDLIREALVDVANGAAWVKIIADFVGPDGNWWQARPNYSAELLRQVVEAVHAKGARVAAHTTGPFADEVVRAGVDSIEHGPCLTPDALAEMAKRGTAWCPTLTVSAHYAGLAVRGGGPIGETARANLNHLRRIIPLASQLGVTILAGTDEMPHGQLAAEIATLASYGLPVRAALAAASTQARSYLGLPSLHAGAPAEVVLFATDPRENLNALAHPTAVVLRTSRVL